MTDISSKWDIWGLYPLFLVGVCWFLGTWVALQWQQLVWYEMTLLPLLYFLWRKRLLLVVCCLVCSFTLTTCRIKVPSPGLYQGTAVVEVLDRRLVSYHGHQAWKTMLRLQKFTTDAGMRVAKGLCIYTSSTKFAFRGGKIYKIASQLIVDEDGCVRLRIPPSDNVQELSSTFSLVEWRVHFRRRLEQIFTALFPKQDVRYVAGALTFGLSKEPVFSLMMHRAGIEHVLAISGFHFGIVAAMAVLLTRRISALWRIPLVMLVLTGYLAVIGPLPSVIRAYCAAMMMCAANLFQRETNGVNCLGLGLFVTSFFDPLFVTQIGFQLSFLATFAILLFSKDLLHFLRRYFPRRSWSEVMTFPLHDKVLYYLLEWFCVAVSLLLPVFLVIIPYQMAYFQQVFFLGLVYNLFIPALFSLAMPLVLVGVGLFFLPYVSSLFCTISGWILQLGIFAVSFLPETSWGEVRPNCSYVLVHLFLVLLLFMMFWKKQQEANECLDAWKACL